MININQDLILVKGEDKTASIVSWRYDQYKPVVFIQYIGGKSYPYHTSDVLFLKAVSTTVIDNQIVLKDGVPIHNVHAVQCFHHYFTQYYRIYYKSNQSELVVYSDIKLIDSALKQPQSKHCFEYLKQIALKIGLCVEGKNLLLSHYEKIDFVREDGVLAAFLSGKIEATEEEKKGNVLYPFGFNISQKKAVENALCHQISVIEGPPGTGKTQTILNIIANAVMRGKSVAVVSSNNSATANVFEKLKKYGVEFIAAPLGNSTNKEAFIESQNPSYPDMRTWKGTSALSSIHQDEIELDEKLQVQNELSMLLAEQDALEKEHSHFREYSKTLDIAENFPFFAKNISAKTILKYMAEYEQQIEKVKEFGFLRRLFWRIKYGLRNTKWMRTPNDEYFAFFQEEYYKRRLGEIAKEIAKHQKALKLFDFDEKMKRYSSLSMMAFKANLAKRYGGIVARKFYNADDLRKHSEEFIKDYPVVLSTTYSLRASLSNHFVYDYVIVDEASQVDIVTGALALSCAKRAVIVGDLKQLPNVVTQEQKEITSHLFQKYKLAEAYQYAEHSLLSSTLQLFPDAPRVLLKEHYRCHPDIIGFCNQRFYNNELIVLTKTKSNRSPLMVYKTVPGNHARNHVNQRQIDVIVNEVFPHQGLDKNDGSVGIVTPYRNQANALQGVFAETAVKADTADKFQGQEKSVIIFSTVDNEIGDFVSDPNRLNVAVSRAIDQFIVVTDGNDNDTSSPIHELIGYIQYHNHQVIRSEIHSVFDYLYRNYADARESVMRKYGRVSEVDSENLMYTVIRDVLSTDDYTKYDVVMHVPLRMILSDLQKLNTRELSFATNHFTHVDFLIYSRLTHQPVLVVEVDGFAYHNSEKQRERDEVKNVILEKYNIPILRLSTVGSGEKQKLISALKLL